MNTTSKLIHVDALDFVHNYCAASLNSSLLTFDADGSYYDSTPFTFVSPRTTFISSNTSCLSLQITSASIASIPLGCCFHLLERSTFDRPLTTLGIFLPTPMQKSVFCQLLTPESALGIRISWKTGSWTVCFDCGSWTMRENWL
jgi:hypothetical protein